MLKRLACMCRWETRCPVRLCQTWMAGNTSGDACEWRSRPTPHPALHLFDWYATQEATLADKPLDVPADLPDGPLCASVGFVRCVSLSHHTSRLKAYSTNARSELMRSAGDKVFNTLACPCRAAMNSRSSAGAQTQHPAAAAAH